MDIIIAVALGLIAWSMMKGKPFHITIEHKYPEAKEIPGVEDPNKEGTQYDLDPFTKAISDLNDIMTGGGGDER